MSGFRHAAAQASRAQPPASGSAAFVSYRACYFADTSSKLMFECFPCGIWRRQNTTFKVVSLDIDRASKA